MDKELLGAKRPVGANATTQAAITKATVKRKKNMVSIFIKYEEYFI
jgi:hypothetical protein